MAARLNTRLIALVVIALVGAMGLVGAFAVLRYRADATRNVRQGDAFMASGDYAKALSAYGRAVNKEPSNLQYVEKSVEALNRVTPTTRNDLRERFAHLQALLEKRVGIAPTKAETHREVVRLRHLLATMGDNSPGAWQRLEEAGQRMADSLDASDPARLDGELFAAVGAMGRRQLLEPAQFDAAVKRLRAVIASRPGDDLANATLVEGLLGEGMRRRSANRSDPQAAALIAQGREALAAALSNVPEGPLVTEMALRDLLIRREEGDPAATQQAIDAASDRVVATLDRVNDAWVLDRALAPLLGGGSPETAAKAADRLAVVVERNPDDVVLRQVYMLMLAAAGRDAECAAQAEALLAAPPQPVSVAAWLQQEGRVRAATTLFDLDYQALLKAAPEAREEARAKAEKSLGTLQGLVEQPETAPALIRSTGRLSAAAGRWTEALGDFERAIRLVGEQVARADLLYESAYAAAQAGDTGLALRRVGQAIADAPRFLDAYLLQADLEQRAAQIESARRSVAMAKQIAPDDERVLRLERVVQLAGGDALSGILSVAQQRAERGDFDGARSILVDAIGKHPNDARLYRAAAFTELVSGQDARAAEYARKGLELAPEDQLLNRALVISSTKDPVDRIVRTIEAEVPDGPDRVVRTYAALVRASHVARRAVTEAQRSGGEASQAAEANLARVQQAVAAQRAAARNVQPPPPLVQRVDFEDALVELRFDEAQSILDADETSASPSLGAVERAILRAQLALARADAPDATPVQRREFVATAVRGLDLALQRNPESTDLHRLLGQSYARLGNLPKALASLEVAYSQRPTDMGVVEAYAGALQALGEQQRLLQVLRTAARQRDVSTAVRSAWLSAEAAVGDRRTALAERRTMYQAAPDDLANGIALVGLLLTLPPSREVILDSAGRERIPVDRWSSMNEDQQRTALDGVRREWLDEAGRIVQSLASRHPDAFELATARADLERVAGRVDAGLAALQEGVAKAGAKANSQMYLTLGSYCDGIGREQEAAAAYAEALSRQGPGREADRFLALRAAEKGAFKDAVPHLKAIVGSGVAEERDRLRLVEALGRIGDLDDAESELKGIIDTFGLDAESAMLDASLAERRLDAAIRAGRTGEISPLEQRLRTSLRRAQELIPTDPVPLVGEAQAILNAWQRKPQRNINDREIDEALALLERATSQRVDYWPAVRIRARIFADRGDLTRARGEVERLLKLQPTNDDARYAMIDLWMRTNAIEKAVAVAREGVDGRPFDARMRRTLGDLLDRAGDLPKAIAEHRKAAEIQPTGGTDRLVMLMLKDAPGHPPEFAEVAKLLGARPDEVKRSLYLDAALAASLANTGRRVEGLDRLRRVHSEYIASTADRPDLINGWYDMLWLVFPRERTGEAEAFVREITAGTPGPFDLREIALRYGGAGPAGLEKAAPLLAQAAQDARALPANLQAMVQFDLGNVLYALGRCPEAATAFEAGVSLQPDNAGILNNLAFLLVDCLDDPQKALPLAQRAVSLAPGEWAFHDTLGDVHARIGYGDPAQPQQLAAAEKAYRTALSIVRSASTHCKLAELMARTGRKPEAKAELRRAGEIDPKASGLEEHKAAEAAIGSA